MVWALALVLHSLWLAEAAPYTAKDVQGGQLMCVLLEDDLLKCFGSGGYLGLGDEVQRGDDADELGDKLPPCGPGDGPHGAAGGR